jgi:hypothetical protein
MKAKSENQRMDHQRQLAAELVRCGARENTAECPHHKCHGSKRTGQGTVNGEALLDIDQDEGQDVEVASIDQPSHKRGPERTPLVA